MSALHLTAVWADQPNRATGQTTVAVTDPRDTTIWYYQGAAGAGWTLIAVTLDSYEAREWQRFRVTPEPAAADVAAWLDGHVTATVGGGR